MDLIRQVYYCPNHCGHDDWISKEHGCRYPINGLDQAGVCGHRCPSPEAGGGEIAPQTKEVDHLLACLIEECAEVQKVCAKALRFGLDDTYRADNGIDPQITPRQELRHEVKRFGRSSCAD